MNIRKRTFSIATDIMGIHYTGVAPQYFRQDTEFEKISKILMKFFGLILLIFFILYMTGLWGGPYAK